MLLKSRKSNRKVQKDKKTFVSTLEKVSVFELGKHGQAISAQIESLKQRSKIGDTDDWGFHSDTLVQERHRVSLE